ncbi:YutD family protein [Paenibacillus sp. NPDC056579]|uniref:YutD family protein n=1 Tax=Paenibacillus sp. NPDC056579 TaxID=3345871 RepID=UPI0036BD5380
MIHIANKTYEVVVDHKNGWKPEAFRDRYSEVLERYDFIVGDWGYNQLRLRGFFKDNHPKATKDSSIATLQDYLNEYCNFGCAYFIIEKVPSKHANLPQETGSAMDVEEAQAQSETAADSEPVARLHAEPERQREPQQPQQSQQQNTNQHNSNQQQHNPNHQHRKNHQNGSGHKNRNHHHKHAQRQSQSKEQQAPVKEQQVKQT